MENRQRRVRARRSHPKSRLGCLNCKKRRIKCDEKKPTCSNCLGHAIECDFAAGSSSSSSPSSTTPSSTAQPYRFRPSRYQNSLIQPNADPNPKEGNCQSVAVQCDLSAMPSFPGGGVSFADLQLFHHFVTSTYRTLADTTVEHSRRIWQSHVPQWGITFPSILHLMLALSALHLSYLHPDLRDQYLAQADGHFTFGVRSVTSVLALLDAENCQLIYMSAVLICFVYFGRGPREGEYLVFNSRGKSEWLVLLHGVRSILASKQEQIFRHILDPRSEESVDEARDGKPSLEALSPTLRDELSQHQMRIREIHALIETRHIANDPTEKEVYRQALNGLLSALAEVYLQKGYTRSETEFMAAVMGWTYRLPGKFIERLEEKEPVALIILAHWTILLGSMREVWFMRRWDRHVLSGIRESLAEQFHEWIEWPARVVCTVK